MAGVRSVDALDELNVVSSFFLGLVNVRVSMYFEPLLSVLKLLLW